MLNYIYVGTRTDDLDGELHGYILFQNKIWFRRDHKESNAKVPEETPPLVVFACDPGRTVYWFPVENPLMFGETYFYAVNEKILYRTSRDSQDFQRSRFTGDLSDRKRLYSFRKGNLLTTVRLKHETITNIFNAQTTLDSLFSFWIPVQYQDINILGSGNVTYVSAKDPSTSTVSLFKNRYSDLTQTFNYDYLLSDTIYTVQNSFIYPAISPPPKTNKFSIKIAVAEAYSRLPYWFTPKELSQIGIDGLFTDGEKEKALKDAGFEGVVYWIAPKNGKASFSFEFKFHSRYPERLAQIGFGFGKDELNYYFSPDNFTNRTYESKVSNENVSFSEGERFTLGVWIKPNFPENAYLSLSYIIITITFPEEDPLG